MNRFLPWYFDTGAVSYRYRVNGPKLQFVYYARGAGQVRTLAEVRKFPNLLRYNIESMMTNDHKANLEKIRSMVNRELAQFLNLNFSNFERSLQTFETLRDFQNRHKLIIRRS